MTTSLSGSLRERQDEISAKLTGLAEEFGVPGAALAVAVGDETITAATGVLSRHTGYPVTTDSWFQIGSVTKLFTSSLIMQAADEGLAGPRQPGSGLPRGLLGRRRRGRRHHHGAQPAHPHQRHPGRLLRRLRPGRRRGPPVCRVAVRDRHGAPSGELFSYCNSGFSVLGRILEVVRGKEYGAMLTERLFSPLGIAGGTTRRAGDAGPSRRRTHRRQGRRPQRAGLGRGPFPMRPGRPVPPRSWIRPAWSLRPDASGRRSWRPTATVLLSPEAVADMQQPRIRRPWSAGTPHRFVVDHRALGR